MYEFIIGMRMINMDVLTHETQIWFKTVLYILSPSLYFVGSVTTRQRCMICSILCMYSSLM